ncbi:MAG: dirigent protein [Polyangiaceae bacterium]|nr:dirigent protein [Polyangiaceae bacterium]
MRQGWVLALGLSVFLFGCAEEEGARAPTVRVIELVEHVENESVTDTGAMGDSVGDILTFANSLYDKTNTTKVGTDQGYCIRVSAGVSWECEWTAFLADGQISVAGPFFDAKESTLTITGGTGAFKSATGEMALGFRETQPPTVEYDFVYTVVLEE